MSQPKNTKIVKDGQFTVHIALESGLGQILKTLADKDRRTLSNMVRVLIYEALEARGEIS